MQSAMATIGEGNLSDGASRLALLLHRVSVLDLCWLRRFLKSLLHGVYRKTHMYETLTKVNAWGAKCNMMHDQEHINPINPYTLFY
jgi:hypothetical protein